MPEVKSIREVFSIYSKPTIQPEKYIDNLLDNYNQGDKMPWNYLTKDRGLKQETIKHFKIGLSENNEITIPVFKNGELVDYKYRSIPPADRTFRRHQGAETWCFNETGIDVATEKEYLIVTEGEIDAMSLWQLGFHNVISISSGALGPTPWIKKLPENINVYLCFDNDEPGQEAARNIEERIGIEKCWNILLPVKDANDFLVNGGTSTDFQKLIDTAEKFKIQDVYKISEVLERIKNNKLKRFPVFSSKLTEHLNGGIPAQSLVTISGYTGVGKSNCLLNLLINHANENKPILLVSLENDLSFTIQRILEIKYNKKYQEFTEEDWKNIYSDMAEYPFYIDISMESYTMDKIETIVEQAKKMLGIEFFGFDHIGFIPHRDDVREISSMVREFKMLARKYDIIVYMISHVRKALPGENYLSTEMLRGSSSIGQDSDIVLFVVETKNGHVISIDKARMSRSKLNIPIHFMGETGKIEDDFNRKVKHFNEDIEENKEEKIEF